jgi:putative ABC transport system permease protein
MDQPANMQYFCTMYNLWHVWKWLRHRPLNAVAPAMSAVLGVALLVVVWHVERQGQRALENNLLGVDMIVGAKGSPLQLVLASLYQVDAPTGNIPLSAAKPYLSGKHPIVKDAVPISMGDSYRGFRIVGSDPKLLDWMAVKPAVGRIWRAPLEVVLGFEVAQKSGLGLDSTFLSNHGLIQEVDMAHDDALYKVVGVLPRTGLVADRIVFTSLASYWQAHGQAHDDPNAHDAHDEAHTHDAHDEAHTHDVHDHEHTHDAHDEAQGHEGHPEVVNETLELAENQEITAILCKFRGTNAGSLQLANMVNQNTEWQAASPAIEMNRLYYQVGNGLEMLSFFGLMLLVMSGIMLLLSLWQNTRGRSKEYALIRSLGARPWRLVGLALSEGLLAALPGALVGIAIGHLLLYLMSRSTDLQQRIPLQPWAWHPNEWWIVPATALIGLLAAALPAFKAYRTPLQWGLRS